MKSLYLFVEFWVGLVKLLWICLVCLVKQFLPVKKKDVSKEIVLITGAGSGIGRLMALEFAKLGAKLVLWDINQEANDAVRDEIKGMGGVAHSYRVDCSKKEEIYNTASEVLNKHTSSQARGWLLPAYVSGHTHYTPAVIGANYLNALRSGVKWGT